MNYSPNHLDMIIVDCLKQIIRRPAFKENYDFKRYELRIRMANGYAIGIKDIPRRKLYQKLSYNALVRYNLWLYGPENYFTIMQQWRIMRKSGRPVWPCHNKKEPWEARDKRERELRRKGVRCEKQFPGVPITVKEG